jgi:hypothetical protein
VWWVVCAPFPAQRGQRRTFYSLGLGFRVKGFGFRGSGSCITLVVKGTGFGYKGLGLRVKG